jgi:sterol desaturase/sphingolipid hydroxylase (fatty acid hydroxylase superfamily)
MEAILRLSVSLGLFLLMVSWEYFSPRRILKLSRQQRWPVNIGLALLNMAIIRITVGGIAYLAAIYALNNQWGLLNLIELPQWLDVVVTLLVLDVVIYFQHRLAHI